jgi:hypothetical protein
MAAAAQALQRGRAESGTGKAGRQLRPHPAGHGMLASDQRTSALHGDPIQILDNQTGGSRAIRSRPLAYVSVRLARYHPGMAHYLFNFSEGDQEQAAALLRVKMWGIGGDEKHRDALAPADLVLIYLAPPKQEFIGQAELASAVHDWTSAEAEVYPGHSPCGVLLSHVEEWDPPVAMSTVVPRIDPEASNPYVQQNAKAGFQTGVIRITRYEYETVLAVQAEGVPSTG